MPETDIATISDLSSRSSDIAGLAEQKLAGAADAAGIRSAMEQIAGRAEELLSARLSAEEHRLIACGPGCAACCRVNVTVLLPEAIAIAAYIEDTCSGEELTSLTMRIAATAERVRWMDDEERIRAGIPCPFLDGRGWCIIHTVRPLTCRALSSTDPEQCRRALESRCSDEEEVIVSNLFQKFLMEETFRALSAAMERSGLDITGRELSRSVVRCLRDPRVADDFLAGKRIRFPD